MIKQKKILSIIVFFSLVFALEFSIVNSAIATQTILRENQVSLIIKNLDQIVDSERDIAWGNGQSRRFLLERDGLGYSLTDTTINSGTESFLEYSNHIEACYCIQGTGEIEAKDKVYSIKPGTMYALDKHDQHYLRATTTMRLICVFTPPLKGPESHHLQDLKSSSYP